MCDGFYWWDVKSCWRNVQKHTTKRNFVKVLLEKDNGLYNVILMETIGISVMVSFGLLFFF